MVEVVDLAGWSVCETGIMITGGNGYSVDLAAISGTPGLSVVLVDENQKIMSWNGAAADLFGVPAAQALGRPVTGQT
jgi:PAS domain-containing protein